MLLTPVCLYLPQCDPELHGYLMGLREPALEVPYFALRCARCAGLAALHPPCRVSSQTRKLAHRCPLPSKRSPLIFNSWYMTWFAHDVPQLGQAARLFDLFLSSHPLMPLYVAAVAIKASERAHCGHGWIFH